MIFCLPVGLVRAHDAPDTGTESNDVSRWQYVVPEPGEPFEHPPLRALPLTFERPLDLQENVSYRGDQQWYTELRYGMPNSRPVAVVLDEREDGAFDLYVDADRNRIIEAGERIEGEGAVRRTALDAEFDDEEAFRWLRRQVIFRRAPTGRTLAMATLGYIEGQVLVVDRRLIAARRVDGDGNGLFADVRDRLWLDLNGDGNWDPFSEQFPVMPVLRLGGVRYALRADQEGKQLSLERMAGSGTVQLQLTTFRNARLQDLQVMLMGGDGSAYSVSGADQPVTVPVGRYALGIITLSLEDAVTGAPWNFIFSRNTMPEADQWFEVKADDQLFVEVVGSMKFVLETSDPDVVTVTPGESARFYPRLYTADGLLINSCTSTTSRSASIHLVDSAGQILHAASSGFA